MTTALAPPAQDPVSILPLLKKISTSLPSVTPAEITDAVARIFQAQLSPVQTGALLTAMHYTGLDCRAEIIAAAARAMRGAGLKIHSLPADGSGSGSSGSGDDGSGGSGGSGGAGGGAGGYGGGLVDIVGTGGDGHDTFNVSTAAAVLAAGCGLRVCKHGNRAATSASGSADVLGALGASLACVTPATLPAVLAPPARFCFLYAPVFHPAMARVAPVRRELGHRTIFNLLGPLTNPVDFSTPAGLEARIVGVGNTELGPVFAETLRLLGVRKGMVVCGAENLDEISCEGDTFCWRLDAAPSASSSATPTTASPEDVRIRAFKIHPTKTFGLATHPLAEVAGGKSPAENAVVLRELLNGRRAAGDAIRDFVVANAAALLVVAGVCGADETLDADGVVGGECWRSAVRLCEHVLASGEAWTQWERFAKATRDAEEELERLAEEELKRLAAA